MAKKSSPEQLSPRQSFPDNAAVLIEHHEGRRARPYHDTQGYLTIGVGRNLTARGLSEAEIDLLFAMIL